MSDMKWGDALSIDLDQNRSWLRLVVVSSALLGLFLLVEPFLFGLGRLQARYYSSDPILLTALRSWRVVVALIISLVVLVFWKRLSWKQTPDVGRKHVRVALAACCFSIVWAYGFYDYNYWLGSWHVFDRLLLVAAGLATIWNPAAFPLFATVASLVIGQFNHPIGFSWTDKIPIIEIIYFAAFFQVIRICFRKVSLLPFLVGLLVILAAFYSTTGIAKLAVGDWLFENESGNIVAGAYIQNGWLGWWGEDFMDKVVSSVDTVGFGVRLFVLALELGFVFVLWNWRLCVGMLVSASLMHLGIYFLTGIFFWKWITLDLAIVAALLFFRKDVRRVFSWKTGIAGAGLVSLFLVLSPRDVSLGWFDTRMMYRFEFTGEDANGNRYHLIPEDFSPFDLQHAQGRMYFLTEEPKLVDCFGAALTLEETEAIELFSEDGGELDILRDKFGVVDFNERRADKYEILLQRWAHHFPSGRTSFIPWLGCPSHIWTAPLPLAEAPRPPEGFDDKFSRISMTKTEYQYADEDFEVLDRDVVFDWEVTEEIERERSQRRKKKKIQ